MNCLGHGVKKHEQAKVWVVIFAFFTVPISFFSADNDWSEQFRREMRGDGTAGPAKLLPDVVLGHAAHFPSAIEMFDPLADEPALGFVTETSGLHRFTDLY